MEDIYVNLTRQTATTWDTIRLTDLKFLAHGERPSDDDFGYATECDADFTNSDIVPIAVGCALAALVVIVLIAYLIGRKRSRQKGYQSV
jgi:lysosomal-associated membrane protein 1/2